LQGTYSLYPVAPGAGNDLRDLVGRVRSGELRGLNVTIPHKQAITSLLDELTPAARAIEAVNTLYLRDGKVWGDNTDAPGFLADLYNFVPTPGSALVLGAGGAARAVVHALRSVDCTVVVAARRAEQARALARMQTGVEATGLGAQCLRDIHVDLIVNATPAGMFPDVEGCPWPLDVPFPEHAGIYDLVYNPPETRLVKEARAAGQRARSGLGMLVEQAALAFELWTGFKIRRELLMGGLRQIAG
jgi:shikimate dehydrogenase